MLQDTFCSAVVQTYCVQATNKQKKIPLKYLRINTGEIYCLICLTVILPLPAGLPFLSTNGFVRVLLETICQDKI